MRKFLATLLTGAIAVSSVITAGAANSDSIIYGDVNNDKKVSTADAVLVMRNVLGMQDLSADAVVRADVDGDSSVTIIDSIYILRHICGTIDTFPVEEKPTEAPTQKPTEKPTAKPTEKPTQKPTEAPTQKPTENPVESPTNDCDYLYVANTDKDYYTLSYKVFEIVNQERIKAGVKPLKFNNDMYKAAMVRAEECDVSFSHTRPNGTRCFTALQEAGVKYSSAGENIAWGYGTPTNVMEAWMKSEGHKNNILNPDFTDFACGAYKSGNWTQFFCKI